MGGLYFLGFSIGIVLVIHWFIQNDKSGNDGPTKGLFAIADVARMKKEAAKTRKKNKSRAYRWHRSNWTS
jgi:hypothetical protein